MHCSSSAYRTHGELNAARSRAIELEELTDDMAESMQIQRSSAGIAQDMVLARTWSVYEQL